MQSPLEAPVQELCNARLVEEFAHMDENKPPIPPSDFLLQSASTRRSADIDPPQDDPSNGPSVAVLAVYCRNEEEVREGFLIALRAVGIAGDEQHSEPATPPVGSEKP
jgi:hypothetical protein